jgi:ATP-binding cassette, subfamily B, bacterial
MSLAFVAALIGQFRAALLLLTTVLLVESALALALPWVAGRLGGNFLGEESATSIGALTAAVFALLAATALLRVASARIFARVSEGILAALRTRLFAHLLALPLPWHQARNRGDIIAILTTDIERLGHFVTGTLVSILPATLTAIGATILMIRIDPALSLLVPILVPAFYLVLRIVGRLLRGLGQRIQEENAAAISMTEEMLDLLPALKSFAAEGPENRQFGRQVEKLRALSVREANIFAVLDPAMQFAVAAATVSLLILAGRNLQSGALSPAETISFLLYVGLLVRPVAELASVYGQVQAARGALARLEAVLETPTEAGAAGPPFPAFAGDIRFEGVTFAYPDRQAAVRDLGFHIRAGETVALTGPNGAGKSTTVGLILGFYRPDAGRILLDGIDIADIPPDHLRHAIGYVPQARHLRNASVADNIRFGQTATMAEVRAAAALAQADDFIAGLPDGYDTRIGDKGVRLSGGQQQRLALARALLCDPPVLILDEATSMVDPEGEAAFIADCCTALAGRTVILITHRPASLALARRILRMEAGRIIAEDRPA